MLLSAPLATRSRSTSGDWTYSGTMPPEGSDVLMCGPPMGGKYEKPGVASGESAGLLEAVEVVVLVPAVRLAMRAAEAGAVVEPAMLLAACHKSAPGSAG